MMSRFKRFDSYTQTTRQLVDLEALRLDGGTQPREALDDALVAEYAGRMRADDRGFVVDPEGADWHKLVVFEDDDDQLWLADGFHRTMAARRAGLGAFQADFREGSLREAVAFSLGVNATHGKRRTNADKRRAVERALADSEWVEWADARLARLCKVSRPFVSGIRRELEGAGELDFREILYREDGQPQHRQRPDPDPAPSTSTPAPRSPVPRRARRTRSISTVLPTVSFDALDELSGLDRLIAYPVSQDHWEALAAHATHALSTGGLLLCCLPQQDALVFEGPAQLTRAGLGDRAARVVFHTEHERFFACFTPTDAPLPARITCAQILEGDPEVALVGQPLDAWASF